MFSSPPERQRPALGLRLAIWYAAIFVVSSLALIAVTYLLLSTSLRQYDREIIESTLVRTRPPTARRRQRTGRGDPA